MKNAITLLAGLTLLAATASQDREVVVKVNGKALDVKGLVRNGITYVPLRAVSDSLGGFSSYDGKTAAIETPHGANADPPPVSLLKLTPGLIILNSDQAAFGLSRFKKCFVMVEDLSSSIADALTRDDIERWVRNRLINMGVMVVSPDDLRSEYVNAARETEYEILTANDVRLSYIYINVNIGTLSSGGKYGSVTLEAKRGAFVMPGYWSSVSVYNRGSILYFGSSYRAEDQVRDALNRALDQFEKDWKTCNPNSVFNVRLP